MIRWGRRFLAQALNVYRFGRQPRRRAVLGALRSQQWRSSDHLAALQDRKLQLLLQHAYVNVPYYHQVMEERGVRPEQIRSARDLALLPLLTKDVIRERCGELQTNSGVPLHQPIRANHTGGSTGVPLTFYQDQSYRDWGEMELQRDFEMCGYRSGDPVAFLWGSDYDARPHRTVRGKFRNWLDNRLFLDAFDASEPELVDYARQIAIFKPRLLVGYVASLVLLAKVIEAHGLSGVHPGAIQSSAEVLTSAHRELIERTFGCKVFNRYGCREVGNIAHECSEHQGLHILADNNVLEVLHEGRPACPGEEGDVVVTNLNNFVMPLIRYVTGDRAVADETPCRCGRGLPLIERVVGRSADVIVSPSGKFLHGEFFTHLFYKIVGVKEFQVIQRATRELEVSIVSTAGFAPASLSDLAQVIRDHGDPAFEVSFKLVDRISRSGSGKFRFTISEVPLALGGRR